MATGKEPQSIRERTTGQYVPTVIEGKPFEAFVPHPLPPDPPIVLGRQEQELLQDAREALGGLRVASGFLPDPQLLVYFYIRKEAHLSSVIEGTQSTFPDLLSAESDMVSQPLSGDVADVSCYVAAMELGLRRIQEDGVVLNLPLIKEMHALLLSEGRGRDKDPGRIRRTQNYIGARGRPRFIPPTPERILDCLENLETYINTKGEWPLIKAAVAHVQFETIHPFHDGNGRIGRLLITLILCTETMMREPLLFLSLYFKENRLDYYDHLNRVRTHGDWEGWLRFFLRGVCETAERAIETTRAIRRQFEKDAALLHGSPRQTAELYESLKRNPMVTAESAVKRLNVTAPTARKRIQELETLGILRETTGKQRHRRYQYDDYVQILSEGTEPIRES